MDRSHENETLDFYTDPFVFFPLLTNIFFFLRFSSILRSVELSAGTENKQFQQILIERSKAAAATETPQQQQLQQPSTPQQQQNQAHQANQDSSRDSVERERLCERRDSGAY